MKGFLRKVSFWLLTGILAMRGALAYAMPAATPPPPAPEQAVDHVLARLGGSGRILKVRTAGMDAAAAVSALSANPAVSAAEPDYTYHAVAIPTDPGYARQWNLEAAHLPKAWDFAKGSRVITVAVLDSGVDLTQPDLASRIWQNPGEQAGDGVDNDHNGYVDDVNGWDFIDNDADPDPQVDAVGSSEGINHGTLVAGIIGAAANNGLGGSGVDWDVRILPLRVLDSKGSGSTSAVEAAIRYAIAAKAKIINISFTGAGYSQFLADALRDAYRAGIIIVAAAGNEGDTQQGGNLDVHPAYPVCYRGIGNEPIVIGVASLDRRGARSTFTSYGGNCVSISAPGENIYTTQVYRPAIKGFEAPYGDGWSGSSLAAPMVAGAAALISSMNPSFTPAQVRSFLLATAADISDVNITPSDLGAGELDVGAAAASAESYLLSGGTASGPSVASPAGLSNDAASAKIGFVVAGAGVGRGGVTLLRRDFKEVSSLETSDRRSSEPPSIAMADVDGDGEPEIVVGAARGEAPYVRVFNRDGALVGAFLAYQPSYRGGVNVAAIDINGDGKDEILTGPAHGGGPHIRFFDGAGKPLGEFFAGPASDQRGIRLAAGDIDGDGIDEIIAASAGADRTVRVYGTDGKLRFSFMPFDRAWSGGLNVAAGDLDGDGIDEIVVGAGAGGPSRVLVFDGSGRQRSAFTAFSTPRAGGVAVSIVTVGGSEGRILASVASGGGELRLMTAQGTVERQLRPFGTAFSGVVRGAGRRLPRNAQ